MAKKEQGKSSLGMDANLAAVLSYLLGIISGLIFYILEKENKYVKFHAMQSILVSAFLFILSTILVITVVGVFLVPIVQLVGFILWILLMVKAYQGEYFKLPFLGDIAEKNANK